MTLYDTNLNNIKSEQLYDNKNIINYSYINYISNYLYKLYLNRKLNGIINKNKSTNFIRTSSPLRYSPIRYSIV